MRFEWDWIAAVIVTGLFFFFLFIKNSYEKNECSPFFYFSKPSLLQRETLKTKSVRWSRQLHVSTILFFIAACLDIHFISPLPSQINPMEKLHRIPKEGIAIYLLVDQSGSMNESLSSADPTTKLEFSKEIMSRLIHQRHNDLLGLVSFARVPHILVPLTLDHQDVLESLQMISPRSTPEDNGTAIGYAIYKTVNFIAGTKHFAEELKKNGESSYTIKQSLIVVMTDGFQDPNRLDYGNRLRTLELDDATAFAEAHGVRLYFINVNPEFNRAEYTPHRKQLEALAQKTGGQLFIIGESKDLTGLDRAIDQIEKSTLPQELILPSETTTYYRSFSLFPLLILLGLSCLFAAVSLDSLYIRKIP